MDLQLFRKRTNDNRPWTRIKYSKIEREANNLVSLTLVNKFTLSVWSHAMKTAKNIDLVEDKDTSGFHENIKKKKNMESLKQNLIILKHQTWIFIILTLKEGF